MGRQTQDDRIYRARLASRGKNLSKNEAPEITSLGSALTYTYLKLKHWDSAYFHQGTSYQCRHLVNQYEQHTYVC